MQQLMCIIHHRNDHIDNITIATLGTPKNTAGVGNDPCFVGRLHCCVYGERMQVAIYIHHWIGALPTIAAANKVVPHSLKFGETSPSMATSIISANRHTPKLMMGAPVPCTIPVTFQVILDVQKEGCPGSRILTQGWEASGFFGRP